MLVNIGPTREPSDIVDLLLECHERIRSFVGIAHRLAEAGDALPEDVRDAAKRVTRYFTESLPLHVADEEESVLPRLSGKDPGVDHALEAMHQEHAEHEPHVQSLLDICRVLQASPELRSGLRAALMKTATALQVELLTHLDKEEQVILPAIRTFLAPEERKAMLHELRARRQKL
jgi:iron-sulfur cluster repair protein YtfE (RIC family)